MTSLWDADGDFDYEAHYEAEQCRHAAATAEIIAKPHLADAIYHFALANASPQPCSKPWNTGKP